MLVQVFPKVYYHAADEVLNLIEINSHLENPHKHKREVFTAIAVATLFGLGIARTGTGIASLVQQNHYFSSLRAAIDVDVERMESSISYLEKSLTSLAEVVLQTRRGLGLLFFQQGGLCATLGEECCFYANHYRGSTRLSG